MFIAPVVGVVICHGLTRVVTVHGGNNGHKENLLYGKFQPFGRAAIVCLVHFDRTACLVPK